MSEAVAGAAPDTSTPPTNTADVLNKAAETLDKGAAAIQQAASNRQQVPGFYATTGPVGQDKPYSYLRLLAAIKGWLPKDNAKYEYYVHQQLQKTYGNDGFQPTFGENGMLVPNSPNYLPEHNSEQERFNGELRAKFASDYKTKVDLDSVNEYRAKALGQTPDTAGGVLVGFPELRDLVDMQRNLEVFSRAGASQVPLGPNGQAMYPKLLSGATAYWVNENPTAALTASQQTTGSLTLIAKTLALRVPISNQLLKFNLISSEAMVRLDMARVAALKADSAMFDGVGGTSIKGLFTYPATTSGWTQGEDKLIKPAASTTGNDGDTLNTKDLQLLLGKLPDAVGDNLTWVIKKSYFPLITTARAGGSAAGDGPYLLSMMRLIGEKIPPALHGYPVVLSSQVPNRVKGSGTALTAVTVGFFPDWLIGRSGVQEIDANPYGDTAWGNIQTEFRLVQYIDAGPRHASSFGVIDTLLTSAVTA